jgi:hypothetical protein
MALPMGRLMADTRRESRIQNRESLLSEGFTFDLSEEEPAVVPHKIQNRIELPVNELSIVADHSDTEHGDTFAVLVVHFRYRDIEPALEPADEAFNNAPFALEGRHPVQR